MVHIEHKQFDISLTKKNFDYDVLIVDNMNSDKYDGCIPNSMCFCNLEMKLIEKKIDIVKNEDIVVLKIFDNEGDYEYNIYKSHDKNKTNNTYSEQNISITFDEYNQTIYCNMYGYSFIIDEKTKGTKQSMLEIYNFIVHAVKKKYGRYVIVTEKNYGCCFHFVSFYEGRQFTIDVKNFYSYFFNTKY